MAGIHNVRLPEDIEKGAQGGPEFNTTINTVDSGQERRNINWQLPIAKWDVGYGIRTNENHRIIRAFFYARRGMAYGFRFKDWTDFQLVEDPTDPLQRIRIDFPSQGVGYGINKPYRDAIGTTFLRRITHPVWGSLRMTRVSDGVELPDDYVQQNFMWDPVEYRISLERGPSSLSVYLTGEFDVPVRFNSDQLVQSVRIFNGVEVPDIPIIELRPRTIENVSQSLV